MTCFVLSCSLNLRSEKGAFDCQYQVMIGTGMGMVHSGDCSDLASYHLGERSYALDNDIMDRYKIKYYAVFIKLLIVRKPVVISKCLNVH